ncbi:tryptophan synthase alpha chain [Candidatus Blochmanniella floridana]|uniref:Tryptophan synthase alpha chain n=1 Tax=Blochmanniella floridana TaxID=203907 RepID=TRPA_BLOFL|nr:RecName: Full=Tryptophan synthase alpha chain [Candidatus Blochmannia floridanus]CAD83493.1 tryptophan synthase alpha chain [Candidatus Blochmannia floridanus]
MNRYQTMFKSLNQNKLGAFVPFITIGDPDPTTFIHIIDTLIQSGADALELGIPFSDPVSDGPSIQKSMERSFKSGANISSCLQLIKKIRNKYPTLPIGLLIYANLIFKNGIKNFYAHCSTLSIDSILIPDLPIEESSLFYNSAMYYQIAHIFICPTNASLDLIKKITDKGIGYIYLLSRSGITGINNTEFNKIKLNTLIYNIKQCNQKLPILQGFGIYSSEQARSSLLSGTSGIISGSCIANIIEENHPNIDLLLEKIRKFTHLMKIAMKL